ncbi:MAG: NUDIX hydrolase [Bryobacterales bacterium]|nr:NUDIX hydrolase [Bryobacterales bacterium]
MAKLIEAAGGLLWRRREDGGGLEIALVHRGRYDDWSLPKGKLDDGEAPDAAALREVREETGFEATLLSFAGAVAYEVKQGPKRVRFWNMRAGRGGGDLDASEVAEVRWFTPEDACRKLTYPIEQAIVEAWMDCAPLG